jgi:transcriptional regulator with XRE-family HTH domain
MPPDRLVGRAGQVWRAYVSGLTQEAIAAEHGITQQRVSQILAEVREVIPADARSDALLLDLERLDLMLTGYLPAAIQGDVKAGSLALRIIERRAKALGLDATEPLRLTIERHLDDEGALVADALAAGLDAVPGLTQEQRLAALGAAQAVLLGEDPPAVVPPGPVPAVEPDLEADFRRFAASNGFDPDDLGDGDGEDGDDDDDTE